MSKKSKAKRNRKPRELRLLPPIDPNRRYPLNPDGCAYLGFSRPVAYRKIADGKLKVFRDGGITYIHGTELIRASAPPA